MTNTTTGAHAAYATAGRAARARGLRSQGQLAAYLFLVPALVLFAVFAWWPILGSLLYSLQTDILSPARRFVGLANFERMFADANFWVAWRNSAEFALLSVLIGFFVPVVVAILVNEMRIARGFFRVVYFLPSVIPPLIALLVWKAIYDPRPRGFLNSIIVSLGGAPQQWLQNVALVKPSMLLIMTWGAFGGTMLLYLAALQDLPVELYEAAEIDGASPFQRIRHITLPHLQPTMLILLILQVIGVAQIFMEPFILTEGGPGNATKTPVWIIYDTAFGSGGYNMGLASAWSVVLMMLLGLAAMIYFRVTRPMSAYRD